ncbi:MAG: YHS domain-containing (seleno)protein [Pseudomonadota bacterium]
MRSNLPTILRRELTNFIAASVAILVIGAGALAVVSYPATAGGAPKHYTQIVPGVAVGGYDPVAYFTEGKARQGKADVTLKHEGVTFRFASTENRDTFKADPAKYIPQYGGHCAWAAAQGYAAKGDPRNWDVRGGKLYLNYNADIQSRWLKNPDGFISQADKKWPEVTG